MLDIISISMWRQLVLRFKEKTMEKYDFAHSILFRNQCEVSLVSESSTVFSFSSRIDKVCGRIGKVVVSHAAGCKVAKSNPGCGWAAPIYTMHEALRGNCKGFLQLQAWVSANGVLKDCMIKVYFWYRIMINKILKLVKKKKELIGLHLVDTQAWSCRRPWYCPWGWRVRPVNWIYRLWRHCP